MFDVANFSLFVGFIGEITCLIGTRLHSVAVGLRVVRVDVADEHSESLSKVFDK